MEAISYFLYGLDMLTILIAAVAGLIVFIFGISRKEKKNSWTILGAIVVCIFTLLYFKLHQPGPSEITDEMEGTYKFTYPTGQVEVLDVKMDHSYNQKFFARENDYAGNVEPLYNNDGNWSTTDKDLRFDHWLVFCHLRDPDSILPEPHNTTMLNVYFYTPTSEHRALIDINSENGYAFEKVDQKHVFNNY